MNKNFNLTLRINWLCIFILSILLVLSCADFTNAQTSRKNRKTHPKAIKQITNKKEYSRVKPYSGYTVREIDPYAGPVRSIDTNPPDRTKNSINSINEPPEVTNGRTVSFGVLNGKAINLVKPEYPPEAKAANASGAVNVELIIDEQGNVISATAVSGHPLLRAAAVSAARASKFTPTILSGQPVKVSGVIVYNFVP